MAKRIAQSGRGAGVDAAASPGDVVARIAAARAALTPELPATGVGDALTQLSLSLAAVSRGSLNTGARRLVTSMWHARRALGDKHPALALIIAAHEAVLEELDDRWVRSGRVAS